MLMHRRNCRTTDVVGYIRPSRKCFSFSGCLLALLLMLAISTQQAMGRPNQEDEMLPQHFNVDEEFRDVDNLEIHHVKVVNGMMEPDHPIIMYKEDFVDEDYVPAKNGTKRQRKYKDIAHRRRHKTTTASPEIETPEELGVKTEKIYFDFLPETPLMVPDGDDNVKPRKSHIKLVPLSEEMNDTENAHSKDELQKRPKKYHRRVRRDAGDEHVVRKRNPYFRFHIVPQNSPVVQQNVPNHYTYIKHAVAGKKHNGLDIPVTKAPEMPISFGNRIAADENDRVVFSGGGGRRTTARPRPVATRRPPEPIFRDPSPENYDYSFMNKNQPESATTVAPIFNRRPATNSPPTRRPPEPIFRDPSPENYDLSFMNQRPSSSASASASSSSSSAAVSAAVRPPVTSAPPVAPAAGPSQCVWAIVNCCSNRDTQIRYSCFEQNGCYGAFWGLNPCAENVRDNFVNYLADYYN